MKKTTPPFFKAIMNNVFGILPVIILLFFVCTFTISHVHADESRSIRIPMDASVMDSVFVLVDNDLIATYGGRSSPMAITVSRLDGSHYKSIPLTNEKMRLESMTISDGRVFYTEYDTSEPWYSRNQTVYAFDLTTEEKQILFTTPVVPNVQQKITRIVADGGHVALYKEGGGHSVILYTISTGSIQVIIRSYSGIHGLALDGNHLMWGCERTDREPGREIHVYTISSGEDWIIPESKSIKTWGYGDISGNRIVWDMATSDPDTSAGYPDLINAGDTIYMTDTTTGKTVSIESVNAPARPFISGEKIVYIKKPEQDYDNPGNGVIRTFDIASGSFNEFGSEIAYIQGVRGNIIIWGRYNPMSFFATTLDGTVPSPVTRETIRADIPVSNPTPAESPVGPLLVVSAITTGAIGFIIFNKRR